MASERGEKNPQTLIEMNHWIMIWKRNILFMHAKLGPHVDENKVGWKHTQRGMATWYPLLHGVCFGDLVQLLLYKGSELNMISLLRVDEETNPDIVIRQVQLNQTLERFHMIRDALDFVVTNVQIREFMQIWWKRIQPGKSTSKLGLSRSWWYFRGEIILLSNKKLTQHGT